MNQEHSTTGNISSAVSLILSYFRERGRHNQKAWRATCINTEPNIQTESQLKQHKKTISISAFPAQIYPSLLSPIVTMKNYERRKVESEQGRGRGRRAVCLTDGYCSVSSMPNRDENLYQQSDSEGWLVSS